jgi:ankyrin repeat protein
MIRYYILTKKDAKGRQVLHRAAECGDKHFCTMICYEAKKLEFVDEIIDTKDKEGLTPLYLLAEVGYRKKYDEDDEEMALLHGLGKTVVEEVAIDRDNLNLDEEGAAAAAQAKQ